jgi:hypothetical protein
MDRTQLSEWLADPSARSPPMAGDRAPLHRLLATGATGKREPHGKRHRVAGAPAPEVEGGQAEMAGQEAACGTGGGRVGAAAAAVVDTNPKAGPDQQLYS